VPFDSNDQLHITIEFFNFVKFSHYVIMAGDDLPGRDPGHWNLIVHHNDETITSNVIADKFEKRLQ
jgi:hypothetical protein